MMNHRTLFSHGVGVVCRYMIWIVAAILGAVLDWHWWITVAIIAVAVVWSLFTDGVDIYKLTACTPHLTLAQRIPFIYTVVLLFCTAPLLVDVGGVAPRYAGILVAVDLIVMDLRYFQFRPHDATERHESFG